MLAIDLLLVLGAGAALVLGAAFVGGKLDARLKERRAKERGKKNAETEKNRLVHSCAQCGKPCDPEKGDLFDHGAWWHPACWREGLE